jgi:8-oxo-dGTP pyrophosphatase MutT (NUDIX family)
MDAAPSGLFSAEEFRRRAGRQQWVHDAEAYGDHRLNPDIFSAFPRETLSGAAVLVPVVDRGSEATVLLTQRTEGLRSHSGQVAFPGGRIDPEDASVEDAALREALEEIGLERQFVETVGRLPDYIAGSGFLITPVLSVVSPGFRLRLNPDEVGSAFEVPLRFLMDPDNHVRDSRIWNDKERFFYRMPYQDWMIWGITAGIIHGMYERLYA